MIAHVTFAVSFLLLSCPLAQSPNAASRLTGHTAVMKMPCNTIISQTRSSMLWAKGMFADSSLTSAFVPILVGYFICSD